MREELPMAEEVRGKTLRWTWTAGPTKGSTHEHVFHPDGKVEWRAVSRSPTGPAQTTGNPEVSQPQKVDYAAFKVANGVVVVSYQSAIGYTLTVALNFATQRMVGFASGARDWYPLQGTFEVVS